MDIMKEDNNFVNHNLFSFKLRLLLRLNRPIRLFSGTLTIHGLTQY